MARVGTAFVEVVPDTKGFGPALKGQLGKATGALVGFAKAGAVALTGATAAAAGFGLKVAASNEQAMISFTTLLGSGQKAKAFMGQLQAFAAKTPFEFPELRDAASRLLAVGTNAKDIIPIMSALGDATAAMGTGAEGIQRATLALQQMQTKGRATGEEMLQLTEAGIPAWDALAAHLNTTVADAQARVTAKQVSANEVFAAIEERAGPAMQRVAGMMDKQSASLTGLFSTLKDTVSQQLGSAMAPAVGIIKQQLPGITTAIEQALAGIGPAAGSIIGALATTFRAVLPAIAPLATLLGNVLGTAVKALAPAVKVLIDGIKPLVPIIGQALMNAIRAIAPFLPQLARAFVKIATVLVRVGAPILDKLVPAFAAILEAVAPLIDPLLELAQAVIDALLPALLPLIPIIVKIAQNLSGKLGDTIIRLTPAITVLAEVLAALIEAVTPLLQLLIPLAPIILAIVAGVKLWAAAQLLLNIALNANPLGLILIAITALIVGLVAMYQKVGWFRAGVQAAFKGVVAAFKWIKDAAVAVFNWIKSNWPLILAILTGPIGIAVLLIKRNWDKLKGFAVAAVNGVKSAFGAFINFFRDLPGRVMGFLTALPGRLLNFGASIMGKLRDGIVRGAGAVFNWFGDLGNKIMRAAGDALSRVFNFGKDLVTNIINGIKNAPGSIVDAIKGLIPGGGIIGKAAGLIGLQHGGWAHPGQLYITGERGPELFVTGRPGFMLPNASFRSLQAAVSGMRPATNLGGPAVAIGSATFNNRADLEELMRLTEFAVAAGRL